MQWIDVQDANTTDVNKRIQVLRTIYVGGTHMAKHLCQGTLLVEFERDEDGAIVLSGGVPVIAKDEYGNDKIGPVILEWNGAAYEQSYTDPETGLPATYTFGAWVAGTGGGGGGSSDCGCLDQCYLISASN